MSNSKPIIGVVASNPVQRMTKGDELRAPSPYCTFGLYELIEVANDQYKDSGRVINIGYYDPEEVSLRAGDVVAIQTRAVHSTTWEKNGRAGVNYRASTRRSGVTIMRRKAEYPRLL